MKTYRMCPKYTLIFEETLRYQCLKYRSQLYFSSPKKCKTLCQGRNFEIKRLFSSYDHNRQVNVFQTADKEKKKKKKMEKNTF